MTDDSHNLDRFLSAQKTHYDQAIAELRRGHKESHWMWYIFPQIRGLGTSEMAEFYSIKSREEASAYLQHPILGSRLIECCDALLKIETKTATEILGSPDDLKLRSSATLFSTFSSPDSVFSQIIDRYYSITGVRQFHRGRCLILTYVTSRVLV
jgi:uncharacterized protein (DUF1810 family)